jgi:non-specific serine/threonine protein kinase
LILDNCEHLLDACAQLADALLRACPHLCLLTTSRELLGVAGETTWRVASLSLPDPLDPLVVASLARSEAVRLFVDRAVAALPSFAVTDQSAPAVAQICWRLDGIPLAIELAAARVRHLSVDQIAARLDDRFRLLGSGTRAAPARHQTLRALVDWSYDLLGEPERVLFRRLAVFTGGWTLEAAEAVAGGNGIAAEDVVELLSRLVDQSLVDLDRRGEGTDRYRMLETLRQYARERLGASGEADAVQQAHASYFLALAEQTPVGHVQAFHPQHLIRVESEYDNLRAALQWFADRSDVERSLRLIRALGPLWSVRGYLTEGQRWVNALLPRSVRTSPELRAGLLDTAAQLAIGRGDLAVAATVARECVALRRQLGDRQQLAEALDRLGIVARDQGSSDEALAALPESQSIIREYDDPLSLSANLFQLGLLARQQGELPRARSLLEEFLALARPLGYPRRIGAGLFNLGLVAEDEGDYSRAQSLYEESVEFARQAKDRWALAFLLEAFASLAIARRQGRRGALLSGAAAALRQQIGSLVPPSMRPRLERTLRLAREGLGEAAFGKAWAEGQAMSLEQAIQYALEGDEG